MTAPRTANVPASSTTGARANPARCSAAMVASRSSVERAVSTWQRSSNGPRGTTRRNSAAAGATTTRGANPRDSRNSRAIRASVARRSGCTSAYGEPSGAGSSSTGGGASGSSAPRPGAERKNPRSWTRASAVSSSATT